MDNVQGITEINMEDDVTCWCPMGQQWYEAHVTVRVESPGRLADFIEVGRSIQSRQRQELIIEDLVSGIHGDIKGMYGGKVAVSASVGRGKHLPVTVTKEG